MFFRAFRFLLLNSLSSIQLSIPLVLAAALSGVVLVAASPLPVNQLSKPQHLERRNDHMLAIGFYNGEWLTLKQAVDEKVPCNLFLCLERTFSSVYKKCVGYSYDYSTEPNPHGGGTAVKGKTIHVVAPEYRSPNNYYEELALELKNTRTALTSGELLRSLTDIKGLEQKFQITIDTDKTYILVALRFLKSEGFLPSEYGEGRIKALMEKLKPPTTQVLRLTDVPSHHDNAAPPRSEVHAVTTTPGQQQAAKPTNDKFLPQILN